MAWKSPLLALVLLSLCLTARSQTTIITTTMVDPTNTTSTTHAPPSVTTQEPTTTGVTTIIPTPAVDPVMYPYGVDALDTKYERRRWDRTCSQVDLGCGGVPFFGRKHYNIYVCPNGLMSFDSSLYRRWPCNFGQYDWFDKYAMLAPYWALTDIYDSFANDISQMYYHVYQEYDRNPSSESILQRATNDVIRHTRNNLLPKEFTKATYVLVVTWVKLRHWYSRWKSVMQNKFNTFQAVLITDGVFSFVLYNYPQNGIQWSAPDENQYYSRYWFDRTLPVVGINAGDIGRNYYNHPRSGRVTIVDIDDIEGLNDIKSFGDLNFRQTLNGKRGRLFIRLEDSPGRFDAMVQCCRWYEKDKEELSSRGLQFYLSALVSCPCTYWQAWRDRRFRFDSGRWPVYCFVSRFPNWHGWGQKCCYEFIRTRGWWWGWWWGFPLLTSGFPNGGNAQRYHQRWNRVNWLQDDYTAYQHCCVNSNLCWRYQERRPSDTCASYVPPRWTWFWGDPHFVTLDGKNYTFNGLGEYVMLDAKDGYFQLQARTRLAKGNGTATVFSGAVAKENNTAVQVTLPYANETMEVLVDGKPYDFETLTNKSVDLNNGSVSVSKPENQCFEMSFPSGMSVTICEKQNILSIVTAAPESFKNKTKGLLGTWNGDPDDDFTLPNGTVLPHDVSSRDIHYDFGLLWQVNNNTSLFTYKPGESFSTFVNSSFEPMFIEDIQWGNESLRLQAEAACNGDISCLFDIASTGDVSVGLSTRQIGSQLVNDSNRMSNEAPKFSNSSSVIYLNINTTVTVLINATDDDGDYITFNVSGLPDGTIQTVNSTSVSLTWKVTMEKFELVVIASDSKGASTVFKPTVYICACHNNGTCEKPDKLANQTLTDPGKTRFFIMSCACVDGYTGKYCESDIDACAANSNPCYPGVTCTDLPPPANLQSGYKCGPCPTGYAGNGANCTDIDECEGVNDCDQICGNTPGSYVCDCNQGYKLNVDKKNCDDINECVPNSDCMQNCINYPGGYACSCNKYFKVKPGDPKQCIPESPCTSNRLGCTHVCYVADGVEKCTCYKGYELADDKKTCKDIDECARNLYRCQQKCTNTIGGYNCSCVKGFVLASDNVTCNDINECMRWTFNCTDPSQLCVNTEGSYKCQCEEGLYWINKRCRALKKGESPPPPPPAPTPKTPTDNELENAVIIKMENFDFSKWNKEMEDKFKEAVAKAVTEYCADVNHDCSARDPNRVITYTADQVHLVPDFSKKNPNSLAFYVNQPPGVGQPGKTTIHRDTLIKIIKAHQGDIGKSINAKVTDIRPYKEPAPGTEETDYLPIIIGSAVGAVVLLLLIIFVMCWCHRRSPRVGKAVSGELLEMQTEIPKAHVN